MTYRSSNDSDVNQLVGLNNGYCLEFLYWKGGGPSLDK